jgi:hypothetical protein
MGAGADSRQRRDPGGADEAYQLHCKARGILRIGGRAEVDSVPVGGHAAAGMSGRSQHRRVYDFVRQFPVGGDFPQPNAKFQKAPYGSRVYRATRFCDRTRERGGDPPAPAGGFMGKSRSPALRPGAFIEAPGGSPGIGLQSRLRCDRATSAAATERPLAKDYTCVYATEVRFIKGTLPISRDVSPTK